MRNISGICAVLSLALISACGPSIKLMPANNATMATTDRIAIGEFSWKSGVFRGNAGTIELIPKLRGVMASLLAESPRLRSSYVATPIHPDTLKTMKPPIKLTGFMDWRTGTPVPGDVSVDPDKIFENGIEIRGKITSYTYPKFWRDGYLQADIEIYDADTRELLASRQGVEARLTGRPDTSEAKEIILCRELAKEVESIVLEWRSFRGK